MNKGTRYDVYFGLVTEEERHLSFESVERRYILVMFMKHASCAARGVTSRRVAAQGENPGAGTSVDTSDGCRLPATLLAGHQITHP